MSEHTDLERRLTQGLRSLAERATVAPDALARIAGADPAAAGHELATAPRRSRSALAAGWTAAVGLVAAAVVVAVVLVPSATPRRQVIRVASPPPALAPVAWTAGGRLYLATGDTVRTLPAGGDAANPQWSADHRWLAYFETASDGVRIVAADGSQDHLAIGDVVQGAFSWSPTGDELAVAPAGGGITVVNPSGGAVSEVVPATVPVASVAWSADGGRLAYTTPATAGSRAQVLVVPAAGGAATPVPVSDAVGDDLFLAGWWPDGQGLLYWVDPGADPTALENGLWLYSTPLAGGGSARPLARTVVYHPWLSWSPDGTTLLIVEGAAGSPATDKQLAVCRPEQDTCSSLPQPAGTVSIDPAWSPDGTRIAFVRAPDVAGQHSVQWAEWFASRQLWVESADGGDAQPVSGAPGGVVRPAWSRDGTVIGFSTAGGVATVPADGGRVTVLATSLSGANDGTSGPDVLGKAPWAAAAVWDSGDGFSLATGQG